MRVKDEKDFYIEALQAKLAEVHQTLAPLVDDDNRPVEALARHAVARLTEAEALIEYLDQCEGCEGWDIALRQRIDAFLA
jgi:hypothetical protein